MDKSQLEKEFEDIAVCYGGIISKICYSFSTDADEYQDLKQEVLYHIWKGLQNFRQEAKLSTWIYRICFNCCISFKRKDNFYKKISTDQILNLPAEIPSSKLEEYNTLHSLIQKLPYEDRVIILMWLDDLSYEEIANLLGIKRNTLATRLKRIKERLIIMNS